LYPEQVVFPKVRVFRCLQNHELQSERIYNRQVRPIL